MRPLLLAPIAHRSPNLFFGHSQADRRRPGGGRNPLPVAQENRVLQRFHDHPTTSTRTVALQEGVSRSSAHKVAQDDGLYPYHRQKVQKLLPEDLAHRMDFAAWVLNRVEEDPDFPYLFMHTDEATLNQTGMYNQHNIHDWQHENPHNTLFRGHQHRFAVNLWVGMVGRHIVGPYILPARMNGPNYLIFLQEVLPGLLEDLPLDVWNRLWYQQDGAPAHYYLPARRHLDATFPGRWVGRGGPRAWPARSPDYSKIDFCYWGWMNHLVYDGTEIGSEEELIARIAAAAGEISDNEDKILSSCDDFVQRCHLALRDDVQGGHFENL